MGCEAAAARLKGVEAFGFGFEGSLGVVLAKVRRHCGALRLGSTVGRARAQTVDKRLNIPVT
jgi:hypothetical protein